MKKVKDEKKKEERGEPWTKKISVDFWNWKCHVKISRNFWIISNQNHQIHVRQMWMSHKDVLTQDMKWGDV